jgi:cell wall-associated NlpC family hydrolase
MVMGLRLAFALALAMTLVSPSALATPGGVGPASSGEVSRSPAEIECPPGAGGVANRNCASPAKARLLGGKAVVPPGSSETLKRAIEAANRIRTTPYVWGGGHRRWWDRGYDCSGSVSYVLHGAGLLEAPMTSGELTRWGLAGKGRLITVYANTRHVFAVIAGLRWDTVGDATGTGPRWHRDMVLTGGYVARHPPGY